MYVGCVNKCPYYAWIQASMYACTYKVNIRVFLKMQCQVFRPLTTRFYQMQKTFSKKNGYTDNGNV